MKNLNQLAKEIYAANHRWWHDADGKPIKRNRGELLMLVITELAEAVEGIRKGLMDDKLPHRKMEEVEMADAVIRLLDFAGGFGLDLPDTQRPWWVDSNKSSAILAICKKVIAVWEHEVNCSENIAHAITGINAYCFYNNLDLEGAITEKLAYNKTRADHTHEARAQAGGKKF